MRPIPLPNQPKKPSQAETPAPGPSRPTNPVPLIVGGVFAIGLVAIAIVWAMSGSKPKPVAKKAAPLPEVWTEEIEDTNPTVTYEPAEEPAEKSSEDRAVPKAVVIVPPTVIGTEPKPKPQPEKNPPPKPEPQPTATATKPPEKPADYSKPFAGFASRVTLPAIAAGKKAKLGPVNIPDDFICLLNLYGGEAASADRHELSLQPAKDSERAWELLGKAYTEETPEVIARLEVKDKGLWLTWTDDAPDNPAAPALRNCVFKISAGQGAHSFAMRESVVVDPVPVLYEKKEYLWELPSPPRGRSLQMELSVTTGKDLPRPRFVGSSIIPVSSGDATIEFGLKPGEKFLKLEIETRLDPRGVKMNITPFVQVTGQPQPVALSDSNVERLKKTLAASAATVDGQLKSLGSPPKNGKDPNATARGQLNKQMNSIRTAQDELKKVGDLKKSIESQCKLKFKVVYQGEGIAAEMMRTK